MGGLGEGEGLAWPGAGAGERRGRLFRPHVDAHAAPPGVLLVHSEPALAEAARGFARALVGAGHAVLVPEPAAEGAAQPHRAALADLERALELLDARPDVDGQRLAVVGLGRGGTLAFLLGCTSRRVAAVVDVGGALVLDELSAARPFQPLELSLNLGAPLLVLFGERDETTPAAQRDALSQRLTQGMKTFELALLEGAGRGFLEPGAPGYHPRAAAERTVRFLAQTLELP